MSSLPSLVGKVAVYRSEPWDRQGQSLQYSESRSERLRHGRTTAATPNATSGTINEVAETFTASGGVGIAVPCDHADDAQINALFERVKAEQGHLDILVNNATTLGPDPFAPPPFWTKSLASPNSLPLACDQPLWRVTTLLLS